MSMTSFGFLVSAAASEDFDFDRVNSLLKPALADELDDAL